MTVERITSVQNDRVKDLVKLQRNRAFREKSGLFVVEGASLAREAVASGHPVVSVFYTEKAGMGYPETIAAVSEKAAECFMITAGVADKMSELKSPQGIFTVMRLPEISDGPVMGDRVLMLNDIQDPANLGAMARSALGFGFDSLVLTGGTVDPYSPKAQRAAMGALLHCKIKIEKDVRDAVLEIKKEEFRVFAAAISDDAQPIDRVRAAKRTAVLIGNEARGLPDKIVALCDRAVVIPMDTRMQSLNAAAAAGILMWELRKKVE